MQLLKRIWSQAQLEAGNYRKQHRSYRGLRISVENPKGSVRKGRDRDGHEWRTKMRHDYGYIRGTQGVDKDHVDCYIGPDDDADTVYIVHQRRAGQWDRYDEDKVMLGFSSLAEAKRAYLAHYDDKRFLGPVTEMPFDEFKEKALATLKRPKMIKGLLFLKARTRGDDRTGDLFEQMVDVKGHTRKDGVYVAPHQAKRKVRAKPTRMPHEWRDRLVELAQQHGDDSDEYAGAIEQVRTEYDDDTARHAHAVAQNELQRKRPKRFSVDDTVYIHWLATGKDEPVNFRGYTADGQAVVVKDWQQLVVPVSDLKESPDPAPPEPELEQKPEPAKKPVDPHAHLKPGLRAIAKDPRVESVSDETGYESGYWVYLKPEYWHPEMEAGTIHEDTLAKVREMMRGVELRPKDEPDPKPVAEMKSEPEPESSAVSFVRQPGGWREASPDHRNTAEDDYLIDLFGLPADTVFVQGTHTLTRGKYAVDGVFHWKATKEEAAEDFRNEIEAREYWERQEQHRQDVEDSVVRKLKAGEQPTMGQWMTLFPGLREHHTYVHQSSISPLLISRFGFKRNRIRAGLGRAGGHLTSDGGSKRPIVYLKRLAEVLSENPDLTKTLFFYKAKAAGDDRTGDLFAETVQVRGHTRNDGIYVAPHTAVRHKRQQVPKGPSKHFELATALLKEHRENPPTSAKQAGVWKRRVRALARKIPEDDSQAVLAMDMLATRLDMNEGITRSKDLQFAPAEQIDIDELMSGGRGGDQVIALPFVSGMSRQRDFRAALSTGAGAGVEAGELSKPMIETVGHAVADGYPVFVDSGAFRAFRSGDLVKFNEVFAVYDSIVEAAEKAGPRQHLGGLMLVMPDVVGDQKATLMLLEKWSSKINHYVDRGVDVVIPMQRGELSAADCYVKVADILGHKLFTVGIPSNEAALSDADFAGMVRRYEPDRVHILGAAQPGNKRFRARMRVIVDEGDHIPGVTADANVLRSKLDEVIGLSGDEKLQKMREIIGNAVPEVYREDAAKVPDRVRSRIRAAVTTLRNLQSGIERARQTDGVTSSAGGRYEGEHLASIDWTSAETSRGTLDWFRSMAHTKGIDPAPHIQAEGDPEIRVRPAAAAWAADMGRPVPDWVTIEERA